jgi:hypothetical protein
MDSGPQYPPPGMELNPGTFPIFKRKLYMDSCPQYPPTRMELNPGTFPVFIRKLSTDCSLLYSRSGTYGIMG